MTRTAQSLLLLIRFDTEAGMFIAGMGVIAFVLAMLGVTP